MRILLLDIETAPNVVDVWGLWQQNVAINQIRVSGYTLCWSTKWYGEKEILFDSIHASTQKKMLTKIHKLMDQADVLVHYNGQHFDVPTLNREFVTAGMKPPAPYKQVDLLKVVKAQFRFPSNKLEYVARALDIGEKVKHEGHELWVKCMAGDAKAWKDMERYNRHDVMLLEKLYDRLLPWIKSHPNRGLYDEPGIPVCPNCGSGHVNRRGYARTLVSKYMRLQCQDCGTWSREAASELNKEDRAKILRHDKG